MLARTDLRGSSPTLAELRRALPRGGTDVNAVLDTVTPVVHAIADRGVEAALEYGEKFDGVRPSSVRVPADVIADALAKLDPAVADALRESITRARLVHADQRRTTSRTQVVDGGAVSEKWIPVRRVGLYVPGGNAVYPSSVIMNVVPAQEAGVGSLVVASPPQKDFGGWPHPTILAACALLGVDEVWAVGGAQGVALLTYGGTDTDGAVLDPVDLITGPGNIYVTAAKRLCRGLVGIDADESATQALGCRDVDVAGTGDEVDRVEDRTVGIRTAIGKERDALRATDGPDLVDAEKSARGEDGRVWPTAEVLLRGRRNDERPDARLLRGNDVHDDRRRVDSIAAGYVQANTPDGNPLFADGSPVDDLCARRRTTLIGMDEPSASDRLTQRISDGRIEFRQGIRDHIGGNPNTRRTDAVELLAVLECCLDAAIGDRMHHRRHRIQHGVDVGAPTGQRATQLSERRRATAQVGSGEHGCLLIGRVDVSRICGGTTGFRMRSVRTNAAVRRGGSRIVIQPR